MKTCELLSLLLALGCVTINGAPVEHGDMEPGSCEDASTKAAAELALTKINQDRKEGYIFSLHRLSNAHIKRHGENSVVFYLILDVVETKCNVLSKKNWKSCETRTTTNTPVYGQCKAAIFINKVHRVERLYKYSCVIRPGMKITTVYSLSLLQAAEREKKLHLLGEETDHSHNDTHSHSHDQDQTHDHVHDHTKSHSHHDQTHKHADNHDHHHTHDHATGSAHRHAHDHSHDHSHSHDHVHTHHDKAHNHSSDFPNQHHDYKHAEGVHTHEHDHELALDHDHKHGHLHEHEHHHHHHEHEHENTPHDHPEGMVTMLPALGQPVTLPSFPDVPAGGPELGVTLPLKPDPQIPGEMEPAIEPFPTSVSAQCPVPKAGRDLVEKFFAEDAFFMLAV
ncbi:histidine-rich glycoprotein-like [Neolamprologus brichardi]|uniref:histidine-rich glycoprotein-like n=1 Tax=Neolamprologus brichardi TaxID=32507 RepID=UPI001643BAB2|nr:histidine-rich glycoprotein-like [Neolamprologus brichardi]